MKNIFARKKSMSAAGVISKLKGSRLGYQVDLFLEECKVQKKFFTGQMSMEEYIGMKKKGKK